MNYVNQLLFFCAILVSASTANAQSLKHNDWSDLYKRAQVEQMEVHVVNYENNEAQDSCIREKVYFDHRGRVTHVQNYFACGKLFSEERLYYNDKGKVDRITFTGRECRWDTLEYALRWDDKQRIVECAMVDSLSEQSSRELFTYGKEGDIVKWQKQRLFASNWRDAEIKTYPDYIADRKKRTKNTVSHIYNMKGLIINESMVLPNGKVERSVVFEYLKKGEA